MNWLIKLQDYIFVTQRDSLYRQNSDYVRQYDGVRDHDGYVFIFIVFGIIGTCVGLVFTPLAIHINDLVNPFTVLTSVVVLTGIVFALSCILSKVWFMLVDEDKNKSLMISFNEKINGQLFYELVTLLYLVGNSVILIGVLSIIGAISYILLGVILLSVVGFITAVVIARKRKAEAI
ncbi:MAG: hypothetical protein GOVbin1096_135 [Prokaryotic dsDNA virus sp.]|jgi:hypothetical protein|nr:MAG: hypothetical protein GOVbin1096_135 [Prokaryotic dsDNA virus sp.]|tara:strand:- start:35776 stop:36306 length:531 start_codon:yes stop_codon:yes gene_type:complete